MMAQRNITDRQYPNLRCCLLCADSSIAAECAMDDEKGGRIPYSLCGIHWQKFIEDDRPTIEEIERHLRLT